MKNHSINRAEFSAIMLRATRDYHREDVIALTFEDEREPALVIAEWFAPYAEELVAIVEGEDKPSPEFMRAFFFRKFSALVI